MKKECAYTQGMLPRYLKGYLFRPQQKRVERHLASCPVCRSRNDALRQTDETREILRYLDPNAGVAGRMKAALGGIARLYFRPLWLLLIIAFALAFQTYVITPLLHDPDLEKLDAVVPPQSTAKLETAPLTVPTPTPAVPAAPVPIRPTPAPAAPKPDPLAIIIVVEKESEKTGMARINEAMKEHALLTNLRFSEKVREVTGSLTPDELYTFFSRIRDTGKISYKRSRLASAPAGEALPFVLKLQTVASSPRRSEDLPAAKPEDRPVERTVDSPAAVPPVRTENTPAPPSPQAPQ
jgi:hypothetical protein